MIEFSTLELWFGLVLLVLIGWAPFHIVRSRNLRHQSELLLRKSQEIAHVGSWRYDHRHNRLELSDEVYRIFGYEPGGFEANYANYLRCIHPDDQQRVEQAFLEATANNQPFDIVHRVLRPSGSVRIVWEKSQDLLDAGGKVVISTGSIQDITEQAQNESKLRQAASVFRHAHEGIMLTNAQGIILDVNTSFCRITGYTKEEALGQTPRLLNSGRQDKAFYQHLWDTILQQGFWQGLVWNRRKDGQEYAQQATISATYDQDGLISHFVTIFFDATEQVQTQDRLQQMAHHDGLTGLPNRLLLHDRLQQAIAYSDRARSLLVVAYLDLDGFKPVNDDYGHEVGDQLLIEVAQRLKASVRAHDTVARLGGDEFVLLLGELDTRAEAEQLLQRIIEVVAAPVHLSGCTPRVSASIGAVFYPMVDADIDTLLRQADQAMYLAKNAGKGRFHIFDPGQDSAAKNRREKLSSIGWALEQGQMLLHYQPIVDMCASQVLGVEALIRWQHPEEGLLLPGRFLPMIEDSKLACRLDRWVLTQGFLQLDDWLRQGLELRMSINIGYRYVRSPGFLAELKELFARHVRVKPENIVLDLSEMAVMEDVSRIAQIIQSLRILGCGVSLDNFGSGYSCLSYFRRLPVSELKIDRDFIINMLDDEEDLSVVEGIIGLARAFQCQVVAEGVETSQHGQALLMMGCVQAQGHHIAPPMPAQALPGWLASYEPDPLWRNDPSEIWRREDLPLLLVEHHHSHWIERVLRFLKDEDEEVTLPILYHQQCRFGRWYAGMGQKLYSELQEFQVLGPIHENIHNMVLDMVRLKQSGKVEAARNRIPELIAARDELLGYVEQLQECLIAMRRATVQ
jgi:diguanylate cyclase (GGDEF)-like protein/PAS domain S-box-containing protein